MSEEQNKGQGMIKKYLKFIDTNILFKKPISCLHAALSLLFPLSILGLFIQTGLFDYFMEIKAGKYIAASILILIILGFAGIRRADLAAQADQPRRRAKSILQLQAF